jgi:hypothetical protein
MPETPHHYDDDAIVNPETKHETSDVNVKALLSFLAVFVIFAAITHLVLWLLFNYFRGIFRGETNAPLTEIARPNGSDVPPQPRLQPFATSDPRSQVIAPNAATPVVDMEIMRRNEELILNNPGWVDKDHGRARIPIELAKQLVVQKGLPVASSSSGAQAPSAATTTNGGQAAAPVAPQKGHLP